MNKHKTPERQNERLQSGVAEYAETELNVQIQLANLAQAIREKLGVEVPGRYRG